VAQTAGTLTVTANRTDGTSGVVTVAFATADGTATAGTDYTAASGTLTWQDGDSAAKTFTVSVNNSTPFSGSRSFAITLSDVTGGVFLGSPSTATATITGAGTAGSGALALSAATYSVAQAAGTLTVTATRSGGTSGAVSVAYATADGTAIAGTDYTAASGTLSWAAGDSAAKTFSIAIKNTTPFTGTHSFTVTLKNVSGGAALGSPSTATATIAGSAVASPGTLSWSGATFSTAQSAGTVTITATRTGGTNGAVTVSYATADGTAKAGTDYTAKSGTLIWAAGDAAVKTFTVAVSNATPFSGTRSFSVALSSATGGAGLASPASATVSINGSNVVTGCAKSSSSYATTGGFDYKNFGNYNVSNNNWGGTSGQALWANAQSCWGVTTTATSDRFGIGSYPHASRGWEDNQTIMNQMSTPGTNDWTVRAGMGISVTALTKARVHWAFNAPAAPMRWDALMDIYFHKTNSPSASMFYPQLDLMVDQAITDQAYSSSTYYSGVAASAHATQVTLGGNTYTIYIDNPSQVFNQAGGHTIEMFQLPTAFASNNNLATWGSTDAVTDVAAIIKYLMQSNPVDDAGKPLVNALGVTITSPLITPDLYLNAINAGFEIDDGTVFNTTAFCVAMQNEPDCN
jgi:hypothetical protein